MLAVEFARFLGLPLTNRANLTEVVNAVCVTATHVGVDLVLVDEVHNLNLATRSGAEVKQREAAHLRRAVRESAKNNLLVAAWNLPPFNVRELRTPGIPPPLVEVPEPTLAERLGLPPDQRNNGTTEQRNKTTIAPSPSS
ncbi:hypothetical protein [Micromonospora gifhornensis]|uniref:hypothetical protein n=1 Tax=Micromonospora gifhornensis TaxID=84594 RepID=UPI003659F2EE